MLKLKSKQVLLFIGDVLLAWLALFGALTLRFLDIPSQERMIIHAEIFWPVVLLLIIIYYSFDFYEFSPFHTS